jgi:Acetyltransferase (GNAT) family
MVCAYYLSQTGYYDFRPLAVFVHDPQTGEIIGGLHGRFEFGLIYVAWFFLPEDWRGARIGSRVLAMAEEEGRRRGCTRIALWCRARRTPFGQQARSRLPPRRQSHSTDRRSPCRLTFARQLLNSFCLRFSELESNRARHAGRTVAGMAVVMSASLAFGGK